MLVFWKLCWLRISRFFGIDYRVSWWISLLTNSINISSENYVRAIYRIRMFLLFEYRKSHNTATLFVVGAIIYAMYENIPLANIYSFAAVQCSIHHSKPLSTLIYVHFSTIETFFQFVHRLFIRMNLDKDNLLFNWTLAEHQFYNTPETC